MSFLGIFGYNENIENYKKSAGFVNAFFKPEVICHSASWTFGKKVTVLVIGILALGLTVSGSVLYANGTINPKAALFMAAGGGVGLGIDLAAVLYLRKKHASFVSKVGEFIKKTKKGTNEELENTFYKCTVGGGFPCPKFKTNDFHNESFITRSADKVGEWHYFETKSLYDKAYDHFAKHGTTGNISNPDQ